MTTTASNPALPPLATLDYDQAGRVKKQVLYPTDADTANRETTYLYNPTGTLKSSTYRCLPGNAAKTTITNAFNNTGIRVARKTHNACTGDTETVYYLGATEITKTTTATTGTTTATNARRNFTTPSGTPVALQEGGTTSSKWTWLVADRSNTIRYTKLNGTSTDSRPTYYPHGEPTPTGEALPGGRGYLNKTHEPNGDLRLDHRTYNAGLTVLTTPDPILRPTDPQTLNPYAYSRNNPIANSDPSGLCPHDLCPDGRPTGSSDPSAVTQHSEADIDAIASQANITAAEDGCMPKVGCEGDPNYDYLFNGYNATCIEVPSCRLSRGPGEPLAPWQEFVAGFIPVVGTLMGIVDAVHTCQYGSGIECGVAVATSLPGVHVLKHLPGVPRYRPDPPGPLELPVGPWGRTVLDVRSRVPSEWGSGTPNKKGTGTRWGDTRFGVRVDRGNPNVSLPFQQVDHVVIRSEGRVLGPDGKPVVGSIKENPQVHIPLSDWLTWESWNRP